MRVDTDPRITAFTTPSNILTGQQLQLSISGQGGTGTLSYSYAGLPPGCVSVNSPSISCSPASSGTYRVTVAITDSSGMTDSTYADITLTQPILGFAPAIGYAVIAGIAIAAGTAATIAAMLIRQKRLIAPTQKTLTVFEGMLEESSSAPGLR